MAVVVAITQKERERRLPFFFLFPQRAQLLGPNIDKYFFTNIVREALKGKTIRENAFLLRLFPTPKFDVIVVSARVFAQ